MTSPSHQLRLELERILPAAPVIVFGAFRDPAKVARWWGPAGFSIPSLEFAPRVGASYRIQMRPPEGEAFFLAGEFREVDPPTHLAFTFRWKEPDPDDIENLVDLTFKATGEATEAILRQGPFRTEARRALHRDGWSESFDKLEALLSGPTG